VLLPTVILLSVALWFKATQRERGTNVGQTSAPATRGIGQGGQSLALPNETSPSKGRKSPATTWTNALGMVFAQVPGDRFWVGTARITMAEYKQVMGAMPASGQLGDDTSPATEAKLTYSEARSFVEQLNQGLTVDGLLPEGYQTGRFALPTTNQWATALGASKPPQLLTQSLDHYLEWCSDSADNNGTAASIFGELNQPKFVKPSENQNTNVTLRLVLVP
jgi:hypothetical protein